MKALLITVSALLGMTTVAAAQPPRIELWGGAVAAIDGPAGTVVSDYSPPLLLDGTDFTSRAGQTLSIGTARAPGVSGGVNLFPWPHLGVQVLVDRAAFDVSGANTSYTFTLQYVSRQPPNYVPQTFTTGNSVAWPDTSGSVTQLSAAVNGVVRVGQSNGANVTLSAGPALVRLTGTVQPLAYTAFNMGGHSVLFENDYRLATAIDPAYAIALNIGGDLNVPVGRHLAAMLGYRYFGGRDVDATATPAKILNPDEITLAQPLADVASRIAPVRARLAISGSRVVLALKLRYPF